MPVTLPDEIHAFFDAYRAAFDRLNGNEVAELFAVPSGIVSDGAYLHWPTVEPIRENMAKLCKLYADNGYAGASYSPTAFLAQGTTSAIVDIVWTIGRSSGLEPWRFNTTYNLLRTAQGWRVLLCTAFEERRLRG